MWICVMDNRAAAGRRGRAIVVIGQSSNSVISVASRAACLLAPMFEFDTSEYEFHCQRLQ